MSELAIIEWASFSIRQDGMTVASGSGPIDVVRREAGHYAMMYGQDGPVKVVIRKLKPRVKPVDPIACPVCRGEGRILYMWDRPGGPPGNGYGGCPNCLAGVEYTAAQIDERAGRFANDGCDGRSALQDKAASASKSDSQ